MRALWLIGGWASLGLGMAGAVLPLLPTVPFLLLAAVCFARSSERFHGWLTGHPRWGPPIRDWQAHGAISRRAKLWAMLAIGASFAVPLALGAPLWVVALQAAALLAVAVFILTRPDRPGG